MLFRFDTHTQQGAYANLTISLSQVLDASFFRVWGAIYAIFILLLWSVVFCKTVILVPHGRIFNDPCLQEADSDASTAVVSSSSSSTMGTEQQEGKQNQEKEGAPMPSVRGWGDCLQHEKV